MEREIARDVQRAARMMDRAKPGWFRRIVWKRLDMQDHCNCIAGQVGLDWADLDDDFNARYPDSIVAPFAAPLTVPAWKHEVRGRRARR